MLASRPFLFAKLLLFTCLGKRIFFLFCFKELFLDAFPFYLLLPLFFSYLPLEPFDLKKVCSLHFLQIL